MMDVGSVAKKKVLMEDLLVFGAVAWLETLLVSSMVVLKESLMDGLIDRCLVVESAERMGQWLVFLKVEVKVEW